MSTEYTIKKLETDFEYGKVHSGYALVSPDGREIATDKTTIPSALQEQADILNSETAQLRQQLADAQAKIAKMEAALEGTKQLAFHAAQLASFIFFELYDIGNINTDLVIERIGQLSFLLGEIDPTMRQIPYSNGTYVKAAIAEFERRNGLQAAPMPESESKYLWEVDHAYYCSEEGEDYQSWQDFLDEWETADKDMNLLFRFDFLDTEGYQEDFEFSDGDKLLRLNYLHQRKGYVSTQTVKVHESQESIIRTWLQERCDYLKSLWKPLS